MWWVAQREVVGWHSQLCSQMPGIGLCSVLSLEQGHPAAAAAAEMLHQDRHLCALSLCLCGDRMRGCQLFIQ